MQALFTFACLSMCVIALTSLLPESSAMRKTALLSAGLLLAALWLQTLVGLIPSWPDADVPSVWLESTGEPSIAQRQADYIHAHQEETDHEQAASLSSP